LLASFNAALRVNALKLNPTLPAADEMVLLSSGLNPISFFTLCILSPFMLL
tara:strand:- start:5616 stop:5768 length:153 start_codon:yes stop_codon:yes gene_type:complete